MWPHSHAEGSKHSIEYEWCSLIGYEGPTQETPKLIYGFWLEPQAKLDSSMVSVLKECQAVLSLFCFQYQLWMDSVTQIHNGASDKSTFTPLKFWSWTMWSIFSTVPLEILCKVLLLGLYSCFFFTYVMYIWCILFVCCTTINYIYLWWDDELH